MSSDSINPEIGAEAAMARSMGSDVRQLEKMAEGGAKNLEKVAAKFESIFLGFLIKQMLESVERSGLMEESSGRKIHEGMIVDMLSDHLAQNGGIGMAKALVSRLQGAANAYEQQQKATEEVAKGAGGETHPLAGDAESTY